MLYYRVPEMDDQLTLTFLSPVFAITIGTNHMFYLVYIIIIIIIIIIINPSATFEYIRVVSVTSGVDGFVKVIKRRGLFVSASYQTGLDARSRWSIIVEI